MTSLRSRRGSVSLLPFLNPLLHTRRTQERESQRCVKVSPRLLPLMVAEVQTNPLRSPSLSPGSPDPATVNTPARDCALDIVKGLLVVLMALYHGINYTAHLGLAFKWLGFLPPAFIFITGLLLSIVYTRKYDLD